MIGLENYYKLDPNAPVHYDEVWVVMRYMPKVAKERVIHVRELAPSEMLYRVFRQWKDRGLWDFGAFTRTYAPQYVGEIMNSPEALDALGILLDKARDGRNIAIACTCYHESLCHRALLGGLVQSIAPELLYNAEHEYRSFWDNARPFLMDMFRVQT